MKQHNNVVQLHGPELSNLESIVYNAIRASGDRGMISDEVRALCMEIHGIFAYSSVTARFSALIAKKVIFRDGKRCGRSGRKQYVMKAR